MLTKQMLKRWQDHDEARHNHASDQPDKYTFYVDTIAFNAFVVAIKIPAS
jgi:hypothetical protein